jgi:hypothetical protein
MRRMPGGPAQHSTTEQNKMKRNKAKQRKAKQSRAKENKMPIETDGVAQGRVAC